MSERLTTTTIPTCPASTNSWPGICAGNDVLVRNSSSVLFNWATTRDRSSVRKRMPPRGRRKALRQAGVTTSLFMMGRVVESCDGRLWCCGDEREDGTWWICFYMSLCFERIDARFWLSGCWHCYGVFLWIQRFRASIAKRDIRAVRACLMAVNPHSYHVPSSLRISFKAPPSNSHHIKPSFRSNSPPTSPLYRTVRFNRSLALSLVLFTACSSPPALSSTNA